MKFFLPILQLCKRGKKRKKVSNSKKIHIQKKKRKRKIENAKLLPTNWTHEKTSKEKASTYLILGKLQEIPQLHLWPFFVLIFLGRKKMWRERTEKLSRWGGKKGKIKHLCSWKKRKRKMIFFASKIAFHREKNKICGEENERKRRKKFLCKMYHILLIKDR